MANKLKENDKPIIQEDKVELKPKKKIVTKVLYSTVLVEKKKGKLQLPIKGSELMIKELELFLRDRENGEYTIQIATNYEDDMEIKNTFRMVSYKRYKNRLTKFLMETTSLDNF